jgi:hypothetical protein
MTQEPVSSAGITPLARKERPLPSGKRGSRPLTDPWGWIGLMTLP